MSTSTSPADRAARRHVAPHTRRALGRRWRKRQRQEHAARLDRGLGLARAERGTRRYDFGAGEETDALRARDEIVLVGHELQDRYARRDWNFTALDIVLSGIYRTDIPRRKPAAGERERALDVLQRLGVAALAPRRFLELSRGEQRRVLIARGVAFEPSVLLLDEPASGLDARARVELDAMLALVARECTLVCAAHLPHDFPRSSIAIFE